MTVGINTLFDYKKLNQSGIDKTKMISLLFTELLDCVSGCCSHNEGKREFAIVRSKLEEACFYAKKSVALEPENQEEPGSL